MPPGVRPGGRSQLVVHHFQNALEPAVRLATEREEGRSLLVVTPHEMPLSIALDAPDAPVNREDTHVGRAPCVKTRNLLVQVGDGVRRAGRGGPFAIGPM